MLARISLIFVAALLSSFVSGPGSADKAPTLSAEDKKYLDGLMKEFLFDPNGAERVAVKTAVRTVWASPEEVTKEGWLVAGKDDKPARVYFADGDSIPAPGEKAIKKIDFKAACKARYAALPKIKDENEFPDRDERFRKMGENAVGGLEIDDLSLAAWLYRLGDEELAAQALAAARKPEGDPRKRLRDDLAWSAFAGMIHAYMVRADEEALAHGERLLRLYAEEVKDKKNHFSQAPQIIEELKRRQKKGTFGKAPAEKWPDGFDKWEGKRKAAFLIDALDEVDARQFGQPGGVDLASDRRVTELMKVGDAAVPALIDALESDERLTRSVHFWRDFARSRTVLGVREAVLTTLMSILRVRVFEPVSTGDNFTARGEEAAGKMAKQLRAYWKEYGGLPFDERMMKVLTDPKSKFEAKREAAENLATFTEERRLNTTIQPTIIGADAPHKANPVIAKFNKPTVAQAILSAMDADLKDYDAKSNDDYDRRGLEDEYLFALIELDDRRIADELAKRAPVAETVRMRRKWAYAAHWLGQPQAFKSFADDFREGKIKLPANDMPHTQDGDQPGNVELRGVLNYLIRVSTPESERALAALADQKHTFHTMVKERVRNNSVRGVDEGPWFAHPFCLSILRADLEDTSLTGETYVIEENNLRLKSKTGWSGGGIPKFLADPKVRRDKVEQRVCDLAAEKLAELVVGLPLYHPMFNDAEKRLAAFKAAYDRYGGNYRRASRFESYHLDFSSWTPTYLPNIRLLDHVANADDVKAGKAIFHLDGKGKPADLKLPAVATLKKDEKQQRPDKILIVQAEVGADGQTIFGVISKEAIRTLPASELTGIKTFDELQKEAKEAAKKERKE